MSTRAHVASKYQVEFGTEYGVREFEDRRMLLEELAEHFGVDLEMAWSDNEDWYEFPKSSLSRLYEKLSDNVPDEKETRIFIDELLGSGDPDIDYVRVEVW